MVIKEALSKGIVLLKSNNIENPVIKARLLMQHVLSKPREYLIIYDTKELTKKEKNSYFTNINKITKGIPLQHITRNTRIYENEFFSKW